MKVEIAREILDDASLTIAVRKINHILAEIVEDVTDHVSVHWELSGELKFRTVFLMVRYEDQGAGATIDIREMENRAQLKSKLRDVWGNLLQERLHRLVAGLKTTVSEEVGS